MLENLFPGLPVPVVQVAEVGRGAPEGVGVCPERTVALGSLELLDHVFLAPHTRICSHILRTLSTASTKGISVTVFVFALNFLLLNIVLPLAQGKTIAKPLCGQKLYRGFESPLSASPLNFKDFSFRNPMSDVRSMQVSVLGSAGAATLIRLGLALSWTAKAQSGLGKRLLVLSGSLEAEDSNLAATGIHHAKSTVLWSSANCANVVRF